MKHEKHDLRDDAGRYRETWPCDACGRPTGTDYWTDDAVCGATDGPGFFLCSRGACVKRRDQPVEVRRAIYVAQRAKNDAR